MEMVSPGHAGGPGLAYGLPFGHSVAHIYVDVAHVGIKGLHSHAMVNHHHFAVNSQIAGENHNPVIGRGNGGLAE